MLPEGLALDTIAFAAFLAFCRIGACFMLMPGFGSARVPLQIRLFIALAVSWALLIHLWDVILPAIPAGADMMFLLIASEMVIGAVIGLVCRFYMLALQFIGAVIAMSSGFGGMVGTVIEEEEPQPAMTTIITFSALLLLFVVGFHHEIVKALVASYRVAPVAALADARMSLVNLTDVLSEAFYIMLRLGSPFVAYGILVNLATGFVNKLAPQIPVYFISLPFVIAGGLILFYFGVTSMLSLSTDGFLPTTLGR